MFWQRYRSQQNCSAHQWKATLSPWNRCLWHADWKRRRVNCSWPWNGDRPVSRTFPGCPSFLCLRTKLYHPAVCPLNLLCSWPLGSAFHWPHSPCWVCRAPFAVQRSRCHCGGNVTLGESEVRNWITRPGDLDATLYHTTTPEERTWANSLAGKE